MKTPIALLGAGGKLGRRIADNLKENPDYDVAYVEIAREGIEHLAARGLQPTPQPEALARARIVILALPDRIIGSASHEIVPALRPGTLVVSLDPACAHAGVLSHRPDVTYFVCHPCHPRLFTDPCPVDERTDWFGGRELPQAVVCALHHGEEEQYATGEKLAAAMFAPVTRLHRISVGQMALLEPAVVESTMICCTMVMKEAMEHAIQAGIPRAAAEDFCLGHIRTIIGIVFGFAGFPFSDGALEAVRQNMKRIVRDDWKRVLDPDQVQASVREIAGAVGK
jgi:D-apionate oxidoisomerase